MAPPGPGGTNIWGPMSSPGGPYGLFKEDTVNRHRLRLIIFLAPAVLSLLAPPALSATMAVESRWASPSVKIDGSEEDWKDARFAVDEGSKAEYAVGNDGENLYLIFVFRSPLAATTIDLTGMKVYFDLDGKREKSLGLRFFKKDITGRQLIAAMTKRGEAVTEAQKAEIVKGRGYYLFECEVINAKKAPAPSDQTARTLPPTFRSASRERVSGLRIPDSPQPDEPTRRPRGASRPVHRPRFSMGGSDQGDHEGYGGHPGVHGQSGRGQGRRVGIRLERRGRSGIRRGEHGLHSPRRIQSRPPLQETFLLD